MRQNLKNTHKTNFSRAIKTHLFILDHEIPLNCVFDPFENIQAQKHKRQKSNLFRIVDDFREKDGFISFPSKGWFCLVKPSFPRKRHFWSFVL